LSFLFNTKAIHVIVENTGNTDILKEEFFKVSRPEATKAVIWMPILLSSPLHSNPICEDSTQDPRGSLKRGQNGAPDALCFSYPYL
jgi:hypothetical protein